MEGRKEGRVDKWKGDYIDGRKEGRMYRKSKKGKEGNLRMDGWVDGRMGGRMYEILEKGLMYERMERTG